MYHRDPWEQHRPLSRTPRTGYEPRHARAGHLVRVLAFLRGAA
jgi:hypothetical protein